MKVKNNLFTKESAKKFIPILLLILGALLIVISYFPETVLEVIFINDQFSLTPPSYFIVVPF